MNDEPKGFWGCVVGTLDFLGLFIALAWPILLLFVWAGNQ
jgi:hypothetical protein